MLERGDCYMYCFFQAEDGIRDYKVTGVQTCALPICSAWRRLPRPDPLLSAGSREWRSVFRGRKQLAPVPRFPQPVPEPRSPGRRPSDPATPAPRSSIRVPPRCGFAIPLWRLLHNRPSDKTEIGVRATAPPAFGSLAKPVAVSIGAQVS